MEISRLQDLKTIEGLKDSLALLLAEYDKTDAPDNKFRNKIYAICKMLEIIKFEKECDIIKRIEALEKRLEELGK